ncbi:hypothetical protein PILCRDRAFT_829532 [Piloderma croceum F 1598]|uniref:Uncharacterized protein n=1 Tax=Piloderma croceum (strain F 1598) TaxID=765440 RepID=A0A0C3EJP8_PILCF|nr:hypothetical protein PILCRDRAFT_829532 [Piloderma croceum F 1598]
MISACLATQSHFKSFVANLTSAIFRGTSAKFAPRYRPRRWLSALYWKSYSYVTLTENSSSCPPEGCNLSVAEILPDGKI